MMARGRGCLAPIVPPHRLRVPFRRHGAMGASLPVAVDLRETGLVAPVKDQGQTGSCEGHAWSLAVETAFALLGDPLGFTPSEADIYRGARAIERSRAVAIGDTLPPFTDDGAQSEDAIAAIGTIGIRPRYFATTTDGRNSDADPATINDELRLGDIERDGERLIVGAYAVDPAASDAEQQVRSALAAKIPVRVDAFVDMTFENWTPSSAPIPAPDMHDPQGGGHAIVIVGYQLGAYVVRNSWGTGWGAGGDCLVSPAWLRAAWGLYPAVCRRAS